MNPEELQKNIALYYSKLPPKLQENFSSMKWLETLNAISVKYGLNQSQTQTIGTETTLVMLGIVHPDEYEETLKKELTLPAESLEKILTEINNSVLNQIRPELIEAFGTNIMPQTPEELKIAQELDTRFAKLPDEIRNIIDTSNYQTTLYVIARNNGLSVTQMGALEIIVVDLMTGVIHSDKFEEAVKNSLKLPDEKIRAIVDSVNEKILKGIRTKMVELSSRKEKEEKSDTQILKSAGIEIIPEKLEITSTEKPKPTPPILTQKLSGFVKNNVVETDHSLHNISEEKKPIDAPSNKPKIDPYREIPE